MTLLVRTDVSKIAKPISPFMCTLPLFRKLHDALVACAALEQMPTVERWEAHGGILRETARVACNALLAMGGSSLFSAKPSFRRPRRVAE